MAHNRKAVKKNEFLKKIDTEIGFFLKKWKGKLRIVVTEDHANWSKEVVQFDDPVSVLLHEKEISAEFSKEF